MEGGVQENRKQLLPLGKASCCMKVSADRVKSLVS